MTIIATPGATNANSYATLAEADTFHVERLHNAEWTAASDATKEAALLWATKLLDVNMWWDGIQTTNTQALDWPRSGVIDKEGYSVDSDEIPDQLKDAQSEFAFLLIKSDRATASDPCGIRNFKSGSLSTEFDKTDRPSVVPDSALEYIQEFGFLYGAGSEKSSRVVRTVRV